jgi:hypothetical protein
MNTITKQPVYLDRMRDYNLTFLRGSLNSG